MRSFLHIQESIRDRFRIIAHYITAFVIAMEGIEHGEGNWLFIILCLIAATIIVIVTTLHHLAILHDSRFETLSYLFEAIVCAAIGFISFHEGKLFLPYAWLLAAILCARAVLIRFHHNSKSKQA